MRNIYYALAAAAIWLGGADAQEAPLKHQAAFSNPPRVTELVGARVRNPQGKDIGEIEDVLVSPDNRLTTAIISVGGFLDIGDKLVAVPYGELHVAADRATLSLEMSAEQLAAAPKFSWNGNDSATGVRESATPAPTPAAVAPQPDPATRAQADEEAKKVFAEDDPRVARGIAENKQAYKDEKTKSDTP
jgi:sporulation protein YlmC with PRC-barrel domain